MAKPLKYKAKKSQKNTYINIEKYSCICGEILTNYNKTKPTLKKD